MPFARSSAPDSKDETAGTQAMASLSSLASDKGVPEWQSGLACLMDRLRDRIDNRLDDEDGWQWAVNDELYEETDHGVIEYEPFTDVKNETHEEMTKTKVEKAIVGKGADEKRCEITDGVSEATVPGIRNLRGASKETRLSGISSSASAKWQDIGDSWLNDDSRKSVSER